MRPKILPTFVIIYILAALSWWSILLLQKSEDQYHLELQLIEKLDASSSIAESHKAEERYQRTRTMIIGEALFFSIGILIGIYFVIRSLRKEIEVANQQSNFILAVTHELKSPLAAIQLAFQTLKTRKVNKEQHNLLLDQGLIESRRLNTLTDNILMAARIDTGVEIHKTRFSLDGLAKDIIKHFSMLRQHQLITAQIPEDLEMFADKHAMESIIVNLISNAVKYSPQDKAITIIAEKTSESIELEICDSGPGIPVEERTKIFEKFYRIGNERTRRTPGSGLGLYLVEKLVKVQGGQISVRENTPSGSIFKISLPNE